MTANRSYLDSKPPFEAAHNCICAYDDIPILSFYKGYFESVYIILHPFYKEDREGKMVDIITWKDFASLAGFADINQLDIALRNSILGLNQKWENDVDVNVLKDTCKRYNLQMPTEGVFQDALKSIMLRILQEEGHNYMFVADEFGLERKVTHIQDFLEGKDDITLTYDGHNNWYTNHNEILYTSHWDSHFTMLCSSKVTIENILARHNFEGFYCDENTKIYWSLRDIDHPHIAPARSPFG
jgi:hypothetical protein